MKVLPRIGTWLVAGLMASPALAQSSAAPVRLEPRTEWVLDYSQERCSLHSGFGDGENSLNLRIDWFGPGPYYRFLVVGQAVPKLAGATSTLRYRFTADTEHREGMSNKGTFLELPALSFSGTFLPHELELSRAADSVEHGKPSGTPIAPQPEFEKQIRTLELRFADRSEVVLALGSMAKPLEAMRGCMDNLVTVWGLDPAVQNSLTRRAVPKRSTIRRVQGWFPFTELARGTNAFVPVRVMVDSSGRVTDCIVQSEGVDESFTNAVCKGLARGYEPALDADGHPVASVYSNSVIYLSN